ncbi:MAG: hypothetical protein ACRBCT_07475 [Alphaproteobacteria bacterium]
MGFELEYTKCSPDSIIAQSTGLRYEYDTPNRAMSVTLRDQNCVMARFDFDSILSKDPLSYIRSFDKTCQIKALMYSNNRSIDLSDVMEAARLKAMLRNAARTSRYAYDLGQDNLKRFCKGFARDFDFKAINIKHFTSGDGRQTFFVARLHTRHDNSVCVRACSLSGIMAALSQRTLHDLITMEFGHRFGASADNLLIAASKLSAISYILDENFIPKREISPQNDVLDTGVKP